MGVMIERKPGLIWRRPERTLPWMRPYDPEEDSRRAAARRAVRKAITQGELHRGSCEHADGSCSTRVTAHHDDYDRPLEVRWLCDRHHQLLHRRAT